MLTQSNYRLDNEENAIIQKKVFQTKSFITISPILQIAERDCPYCTD